MNNWSEQFYVPYPNCNMCAQCCRCASPSLPTEKLKKRAVNGDGFARDFLDIFIPYETIEDAKKVSPYTVDKSIEACKKTDSKVNVEDLIFYRCKYFSKDNKCLIHEDRPKLCRDYPDMPYLIFPDGCAYIPWSEECKVKYKALQDELSKLKQYQKEIENLRFQQQAMQKMIFLQKIRNDNKFVALVPQCSLVSPKSSWLNKY